jgi:hypothetical protein
MNFVAQVNYFIRLLLLLDSLLLQFRCTQLVCCFCLYGETHCLLPVRTGSLDLRLHARDIFGLPIQLIFEVSLLDCVLFQLKLQLCNSPLQLAVFVAQTLNLLLKPSLILPESVYLNLQLITQH